MINANSKVLLDIRDLTATVAGVTILKGINLTVKAGEVHAIMGPNGSGKSTLAKVLAGHPAYEVTGGTVQFEGKDLFALAAEDRARAGIFLGFQYPVEIPGVSNSSFLRLAYNTVQGARGKDELDPLEFDDYVREKMKLLEMSPEFLDRSVNDGFSGGEKKRNEILQMAILEPHVAILDETDSGLDIDALRIVAGGVNKLLTPDNACVLVTHYQRLLNYITPDYVHVMESDALSKPATRRWRWNWKSAVTTGCWTRRLPHEGCRTRASHPFVEALVAGGRALPASPRRGSISGVPQRWSGQTRWRCRRTATKNGVLPTSRR